MLREVLEHTGIDSEKVATLLGINPDLFQEWLSNQRPIPQSVLGVLSNVIGLDLAPLLRRKIPTQEAAAITPAIWYRFRGEKLVPQDREFVFLIRRLGYFINELEEITSARAVGWKFLFQEIRQNVDIQAPPRIQGIQAANMFREARGLATGAIGIGEVLRGNLRSMGVLVVETPVPQSQLEGCCFYLGSRPSERPCIFANTHHTTWFRRNAILLHEIAHGIFEAESGATLDFFDSDRDVLAEERADAFAQQVLVPKQVLQNVAQKNRLKWDELSAAGLARIVAETHAEQRTILRAATEAELISPDRQAQYEQFDIAQSLMSMSTHALSTEEFLKVTKTDPQEWLGKRNTTIPSSSLRLPAPYIKAVLQVFRDGHISRGKAAEMLMIDTDTFEDRFGDSEDCHEEVEGNNLPLPY